MDERLGYIDDLALRAASVEINFVNALLGSKEGAISRARSATLPITKLVEASGLGFQEALSFRTSTLSDICRNIANLSLNLAGEISGRPISKDATEITDRHVSFVMRRLEADGARRVEQYQLNMKRIAIIARSMRDDNDWDASAALLRSRESVDIRSKQSLDALGRKQLTERFTKLMVRGLGISCLVDSVMSLSPDEKFGVFDFDGNPIKVVSREDYEEQRESLFHPQCRRYLRLLGK